MSILRRPECLILSQIISQNAYTVFGLLQRHFDNHVFPWGWGWLEYCADGIQLNEGYALVLLVATSGKTFINLFQRSRFCSCTGPPHSASLSLVIWAVARRKELWNPRNIFILNLAISDICECSTRFNLIIIVFKTRGQRPYVPAATGAE